MKTFTFCSFKGGTTKTSTCLNIGACLAKLHKKKCLLIDFDPQANLSIGLGIGPDTLETMVLVLQGKAKIRDVIQESSLPNLSIIPANSFLDSIEKCPELFSDPYAHEKLRSSLKELEKEYDYCLIDTPPSLNWLTQSAFFASEYSIVCSIPEAFSVLGLYRLKDFHSLVNKHHHIETLGVVLSFWDDRGAVNQSFLDKIEEAFPNKIFKAKIRRDVSVSRAVLQGKPVIEADPNSRASLDYIALTKEFMKRLQNTNPLKKLKEKKLIAGRT